ncbi:DNA-directed RNA polymerase [Paenibacillus sp. 481]|uniref:DNA-directed RNA polymerase n=1 Tax=Paenibacillus sp. 481 TaxID=2835869 RepID=UPI001E2BCDA8|nr:DNA-directed RNA polymerase [Paenibacillus sp. 481]
MRVTTFIAGTAIGILAGMYMADRRSLAALQSKLQTAGNVVQDLMSNAKGSVLDNTLMKFADLSSLSTASSAATTSAASQGQGTGSNEVFSLDRVKDLINNDPAVKRKVDAILRENGLAPTPTAPTKSDVSKASSSAASGTAFSAKSSSQQGSEALDVTIETPH